MHQIVVEDVSEPQPDVQYPICTGGERRCPPEDCSGIHGYYNMLEILDDPEHEQYAIYREWLPRDFDPDEFDVDEANEELEGIGE